ncbi:MAG TPA: glutamine--tRNA ligase/YqeY domain fusion protein [bacterium]|nr:glutamine--tRNA ligase/YqeY domain fusion protein [bacterium]
MNGKNDKRPINFIETIIEEDRRKGKNDGRVHTRFPPEPNGYLHIGHAKSICLNFGLAEKYGGLCNLRFDDTNPTKESVEYIESIKHDVRWLGFDWEERLYYASDYFEKMVKYAEQLIREGKAYVDDSTADEIREYRGTLTQPGKESPWRNRSIEENLELFQRMKSGEYPDGSRVLRAKIDMGSSNLNMRDPVMYRILHAAHPRTGKKWCIYPMYDWAHGLEDSIEKITHSICTLEFEDHRPLYDWFLDQLRVFHPRQIEFARLNLTYTVMSKRKLLDLVQSGEVQGWDDPRMPTLSGLRRRGYTPSSIRQFADRIGVAKRDSTVDIALLEYCIREELNAQARRFMAVLRPLKVIITNYPEGRVEKLEAVNNPEDPSAGTRKIPFSREIYIERDDFMQDPPKKFYRLAPGREIRLRYAYFITCEKVIRNEAGEIEALHCTYDPATRGGDAPDNRRVKATLHWVSVPHARNAEVRLYDRLFDVEYPEADKSVSFKAHLNRHSLEVIDQAKLEPALFETGDERVQFERLGYFIRDPDSRPNRPVYNRIITLRDAWARIREKQPPPEERRVQTAGTVRGDSEERMNEITIDDFRKIDLRAGRVVKASLVEGADKLLSLQVDVGEETPRQIFAGIRSAFPEPEVLVGKMVIVAVNLAPRKMRFGVSHGMILAGTGEGRLSLATFSGDAEPGDSVT